MKFASAAALAGGGGALLFLSEARLRRAQQPSSDRWQRVPVRARGRCELGLSFRPLQAEALGLSPEAVFDRLLQEPAPLIRLGAYWNRIETKPGTIEPAELDARLERAAAAGKRVILAVGAVKTFGYPELHLPSHLAPRGLPEGTLISPTSHQELAAAAQHFVAWVVDRYRSNPAVIAWQVENEALDPLGVEHSWRLSLDFVAAEAETVRRVDPGRPVLMSGFVPLSAPVRLSQWWRTRGQGDSLAGARALADQVCLDLYPRHAVAALGDRTIYLDGGSMPWSRLGRRRLNAAAGGRPVLVTEGQAEPWEAVTVPPSPGARVPFSCPPERVILNYNLALRAAGGARALSAYLFWGFEYWLRREADGDPSYLGAFHRVASQP